MRTNSAVISGYKDNIAPQALDFKSQYMQFGDLFARIMVITDYPPRVTPAWLNKVAKMPGVVCSVHVTPTDPTDLIKNINTSIGELTGRLEQGSNALLIQRTEQALKDANELLRKIDQEQQNVFYLTTVLMVIAKDEDTLNRRTRLIEGAFAAAGMRGRTALFRQEEGLKAVSPWGILTSEIESTGARNMPSETVAATFPFTASGINDGKGIVIGTDTDGGIVLIDIWSRGNDRTNSNLTILGKPGTGKSFLMKLIILRELAQGARVIIIDPEREYKQMCKELGGDWVNFAGGKEKINPLQIRIVPIDEDNSEETHSNPLQAHMQTLKTFFSLYLKDLTDLEKALLEEALIEVYMDFNIDFNTEAESVTIWPNITHLHANIKKKVEDKKWERLEVLLRSAAFGADSALWAGDTTTLSGNDLIVLDTHELQNSEESVRRAQYFNVLGYAWNEIERDRKEKILLIIDEVHILLDPQTPQAIKFAKDASKRIRKYMGGLVTASQNTVDFLDPAVIRYGQALIDNPTYKLLLGQGEKDLQALNQLMALSEAENDLLATAKRGEGLLIAGNQRIQVKIEAAAYEFPYLTGGGA